MNRFSPIACLFLCACVPHKRYSANVPCTMEAATDIYTAHGFQIIKCRDGNTDIDFRWSEVPPGKIVHSRKAPK